jgi:hypothetical protein
MTEALTASCKRIIIGSANLLGRSAMSESTRNMCE